MVKIMIIDDSDAIRMVLKDIMVIGQHSVITELSSGMRALDEYIKSKPDIVLLDMAMPKKDGLSVLKEVIAYNPKAKIIMISASDNQETVKDCMDAGASAYILKPFNFQEVLNVISQVAKS